MSEEEMIRKRASIALLEAETLRVRIRMEGMKAVNRQRKLAGQKTLRHLDEDYRALEASIVAAMANFTVAVEASAEQELMEAA